MLRDAAQRVGDAMEYTLAAAAETTGISKSAIHRAIQKGRLSARKLDDGTLRIDGAELARVYPPSQVRDAGSSPWDTKESSGTPGDGDGTELAVLRVRLQMIEDQLTREREDRERERETILERERETVADLRKRLDRSEERVLALTAQPVPQPAQEPPAVVEELRRRLETSEARVRALVTEAPLASPPPSKAAQDAFSVVEELRKRREASKALLRVLETPAPQMAQEQSSEVPAGTTPAGSLRGLLARLLGR